jgi:flavin reductase (DIM6/NTAB) family NADH-FMN oxidoreductase RutF
VSFPTNQDLNRFELRKIFGVFPTGVVAVAAAVDDNLIGLAASSFTSISLDPPLVSFSVAKTSQTWPLLRRANGLGVTVLAEHHGAVALQLAGPVDERFEGIEIVRSLRGAVTLVDGLAQLETSIYREVEAGDHVLVLLRLHAVQHAGASSPLVFHGSVFRRLAAPDVAAVAQ